MPVASTPLGPKSLACLHLLATLDHDERRERFFAAVEQFGGKAIHRKLEELADREYVCLEHGGERLVLTEKGKAHLASGTPGENG